MHTLYYTCILSVTPMYSVLHLCILRVTCVQSSVMPVYSVLCLCTSCYTCGSVLYTSVPSSSPGTDVQELSLDASDISALNWLDVSQGDFIIHMIVSCWRHRATITESLDRHLTTSGYTSNVVSINIHWIQHIVLFVFALTLHLYCICMFWTQNSEVYLPMSLLFHKICNTLTTSNTWASTQNVHISSDSSSLATCLQSQQDFSWTRRSSAHMTNLSICPDH